MNLDNEILTNIKTDQALNSILEKFDTNYIIHIVEDSINLRFRPYNTAMPGLNSIEEYFQRNINNFPPSEVDQIIAVRYETYRKIIDIVCNFYNLTYIDNPQVDIYSAAYYIYRTFVSDFTNTVTGFFIKYIIDNQDAIYNNLNLIETRKNKDSSSNYSKRLYTNQKLGLIHANIAQVLDDICTYDISIYDVIREALKGDNNTIAFLCSILQDNGTFFKTYISCYLNNMATRADIITNIKLNLQEFGNANSDMILKNEEIK